jgi:hypothetical protein
MVKKYGTRAQTCDQDQPFSVINTDAAAFKIAFWFTETTTAEIRRSSSRITLL